MSKRDFVDDFWGSSDFGQLQKSLTFSVLFTVEVNKCGADVCRLSSFVLKVSGLLTALKYCGAL